MSESPHTSSNQESCTSPIIEANNTLDVEHVEEEENHFEKTSITKTCKVWDKFKKIITKEGMKKDECIYCKSRFALKQAGATSAILRHSKGCARRQHTLSGRQSHALVPSHSKSISGVQNFKNDHAIVKETSVHMVMVHELSFNFMGYELVTLLMNTTTPHFQNISKATLENDCMSAYDLKKKKIKALLVNVDKVCLTTNL